MVQLRVNVDTSGPLFNGAAQRAAAAFVDETEKVLTDHAYDAVQTRLAQVLRNPTGYYQSQIQIDRTAGDHNVNDGGVIYGPWLEGVGSRNQTTRFKGYFTFRLVGQMMNQRAVRIAERVWPKYARRMQ